MSKEEKYYCARCGSDLTEKPFTCYASEIDRKLICLECFKKEQPKFLANKVADLEAKLAEAQKIIEIQKISNDALIDENLDYRYDITDTAYEQAKYMAKSWEEDYQQEIAELKQQLAEKEKENLTLFSMLYETLEKQGCENITSTIEQMTNLTLETQSNWFKENCVKDQDKISFCIEELEKAKEFFLEEYRDEEMDTDYIVTKDAGQIADYLLDQIKQLKENRNEEV